MTGCFCRYPNLLLFTSAKEDLEDLTQEVHDLVTMDEEQLPSSARELAKTTEGNSRLRPDVVWSHLQEDDHPRWP